MEKITIEKINQAAAVLSKILTPTPLIRNEWLSKNFGCEVFLKLETMQPIGSFKIRGATYKISQLSEADRKKGVIAASAGNHAQGVAWGARYFNANALIVMPETAPLMKIQNTRELGAEVHLEGDNYDESYQVAQRIVKESGRIYVHAFHDETVIAGQATTALEILSQCPDVDYVVSSIGGGGLTAGIGIVLKKLKPAVKLIGCQAQNASAMTKSISKKQITESEYKGTFADGIGVQKANPDLFKILNEVVDQVFEADEDEIASSVLQFMEKAKIMVEGSGAIVLGALPRFRDEMQGKKVVLVVTGGNIDVNLVSRIIDRGLMRTGRRVHLRVQISDRPGSLSKLTALIAALKANVLQAVHDRSELKIRLDETEVELMLETRGQEHTNEVIKSLEEHCRKVTVIY
jgi:threonine dehydratase